jgi:hypothetical protein
MNIIKSTATAVGMACLIGTAAPVFAGSVPNDAVQPIVAEVLPTPQETQNELAKVAKRLHRAEFASVSSSAADRDYVAAWRDYDQGWYQNALDEARAADAALKLTPNWVDTASK